MKHRYCVTVRLSKYRQMFVYAYSSKEAKAEAVKKGESAGTYDSVQVETCQREAP